MRCDDIRDRLDDLWDGRSAGGDSPAPRPVRRVCQLSSRPAPGARGVPPIAARGGCPRPHWDLPSGLVRQLGEMSKAPSVADFFERVGQALCLCHPGA